MKTAHYGRVMELVYMLVLETSAARIEGSTPFSPTLSLVSTFGSAFG